MNVLFMTDKLIMGGAEIYFCKLENQLNHENITYYTAAGEGELVEKIKNKENFIPLKQNMHGKNLFKLIKKIRNCNIDVIHANSLRMVLYAIAIRIALLKNIKIIYTKHNVTLLEKRLGLIFSKLITHTVNKVITVCEFEKNNLVKLGVPAEKITTVHNGVDLTRFSYRTDNYEEGNFKVGILGRLSEEKNHALFIDIARGLKDDSTITFHIAGDGPEFKTIASMIKKHGLEKKVAMLGKSEDPEEFISSMDVLLLTSFREVFPMVLLEAMAVGTPVISVDTGGIKEALKNQETGFLVPSYSPDDFIEKILLLKENSVVRKSFSIKGREHVGKYFTSERMTTLTLNEYLNLSGERMPWTQAQKSGLE